MSARAPSLAERAGGKLVAIFCIFLALTARRSHAEGEATPSPVGSEGTPTLAKADVTPADGAGAAAPLTKDPKKAAELTRQALVLLERGEDSDDEEVKMAAYVEGERLARQALALDDENADTYFAVFATEGRRLVMQGSVNPFSLLKVNRHLDRCLELNPDHSDALAARGGMYRQLPLLLGGSLKKAEADLKRSIELDPQATGARIELAKTYHEMGEEEKVMPLIQQALVWAEKLNKPRRIREARAFLIEVAGQYAAPRAEVPEFRPHDRDSSATPR